MYTPVPTVTIQTKGETKFALSPSVARMAKQNPIKIIQWLRNSARRLFLTKTKQAIIINKKRVIGTSVCVSNSGPTAMERSLQISTTKLSRRSLKAVNIM